jgi:hypothetical protein
MMLGCGEPAAGDPQLDSLPSVGDEAPRLPSFDWDRGRHAITAHQLVDLLRNRFFNVLLVDASSEGPGAAQIAGRQMDAPAVGTVTRQQPQKPDSWLASTMDRHKEYPPIVGSRRFLSLSRTRDAVRFVSLAKLAEEDKRASVGPDGEQGALFGDETAINGDELVDGKSPSSSGKKKRDSGVDLRDQGESCTDESDASDDEEDLELVKMQTFAKEMQEGKGLWHRICVSECSFFLSLLFFAFYQTSRARGEPFPVAIRQISTIPASSSSTPRTCLSSTRLFILHLSPSPTRTGNDASTALPSLLMSTVHTAALHTGSANLLLARLRTNSTQTSAV